tara:strand:- start:4712 stop:5089 length:378 start_codon:yes stop_codon:yes gene_type:complete
MIDKIALFALLIMTLIYICSEKKKYESTKEDFVNVRKSESPNINRNVDSRFTILPSTSNKENFKNPCDPIKRRRDRLKRELESSEMTILRLEGNLRHYKSQNEILKKKIEDLKAHHNFLVNSVED